MGKKDRERPRSSFIEQMISDVGPSSYVEPERLADKRE
jgi:hypothetical protein